MPEPFSHREPPLSLELDDGRLLEVHAGGAANGVALLFHHGTPGCGRGLPVLQDACVRHGLRWLGITRPGYGSSTRQPGRTVADAVADGLAVLDRLGVERCLVAGWSGGGPVASAFGALAPQRVLALAVIAGSAPYPAVGLDWYAGLDDDEAAQARAAVAGEAELRATITPRAAFMATITGEQLRAPASWRPAADGRALDVVADDMAANFRDALAPGVDGYVDDYVMFMRPWGFDPSAITVPTTLWQGGRDRLNPAAHTRWLAARIPGARLHVEPDDGHISIVTNNVDRMLAELRELAGV